MIPVADLPPGVVQAPVPRCAVIQFRRVAGWMRADGIAVRLPFLGTERGDLKLWYEDGSFYTPYAYTWPRPDQRKWFVMLSHETIRSLCAIRRARRLPAMWDLNALQTVAHELLHQFSMPNEGLVEAVARDLTVKYLRKYYGYGRWTYSAVVNVYPSKVARVRIASAQSAGVRYWTNRRATAIRRAWLLRGGE